MHRFDCEKEIEKNKQSHLSMNLKRAPMYSKMVEDMLQITKIQHEATLECKWEAFKKFILVEIFNLNIIFRLNITKSYLLLDFRENSSFEET